MAAEATIGSGPETKRPLQQGMKPNLGRYWTDQEIINAVAYLKSTHPKLWDYLRTDALELTYLSEGDGYFPMRNALEQLHPGLGIGGYGNLIVGVTNALFNELNLPVDQAPGIEEWGTLAPPHARDWPPRRLRPRRLRSRLDMGAYRSWTEQDVIEAAQYIKSRDPELWGRFKRDLLETRLDLSNRRESTELITRLLYQMHRDTAFSPGNRGIDLSNLTNCIFFYACNELGV